MDNTAEITEYDLEKEFNKDIKPLAEELLLLCRKYKIPAFMTFCYKNTSEDSDYYSNMVSPKTRNLILKKDYIGNCVKIIRGYKATLDGTAVVGCGEDSLFNNPAIRFDMPAISADDVPDNNQDNNITELLENVKVDNPTGAEPVYNKK